VKRETKTNPPQHTTPLSHLRWEDLSRCQHSHLTIAYSGFTGATENRKSYFSDARYIKLIC